MPRSNGSVFVLSGARPAHDACFEDVNAAGNAFGNCGKDEHGNYMKCDKRFGLFRVIYFYVLEILSVKTYRRHRDVQSNTVLVLLKVQRVAFFNVFHIYTR